MRGVWGEAPALLGVHTGGGGGGGGGAPGLLGALGAGGGVGAPGLHTAETLKHTSIENTLMSAFTLLSLINL